MPKSNLKSRLKSTKTPKPPSRAVLDTAFEWLTAKLLPVGLVTAMLFMIALAAIGLYTVVQSPWWVIALVALLLLGNKSKLAVIPIIGMVGLHYHYDWKWYNILIFATPIGWVVLGYAYYLVMTLIFKVLKRIASCFQKRPPADATVEDAVIKREEDIHS